MNLSKFFSICICLLFANLAFAQKPINSNDDFCYAKLKSPDQYDTVEEEILVQAESTKTIKVPAVYDSKTDQLLVKPESKRITYVPAVYKTISEKVVDRPQSSKMVTIPAVFEKRTEKVLVKEASKQLVPVPAVYEVVEKQILVTPETRRFKLIPAVFESKTEKVVAKAASERFVTIPAEYETVMEKIEIEPATTRIETLTPQYKTETEKVMTRPSYNKWVKSKGDATCLSADPEDCMVWCLVEVPAQYNVVSKRINIGCDGSGVTDSGCTKEIAVPAKYANKPKQVLRSPVTTRAEMIPEEYVTITRSVLKTPARTEEEMIPPVYETYSLRKVKSPATVREIEIPAIYENKTIEVVVSPARTEEQIIPATYKTITKRVIETPATTVEKVIPAVYNTVAKRVLVSPETVKIETIPAIYKKVIKRVLRSSGDNQWKRIVCPKFQDAALNGMVQEALRKAGFNPGPSDQIFGPKTYAAMVAFQKANNLWYGQLDYATMDALNVPLPEEAFKTPQRSNFANSGVANEIFTSRGEDKSQANGSSVPNGVGQGNSGSNSNKNSGNSSENSDDDEASDEATTMSSEEMQMIDEINLMRKDPKGYVTYVEDYIKQVEKDPGLDAAYKADEISSAKELISELKNLKPLPTLTAHEGLHRVGIKHGKDVQGQGMIGHRGSDGTMPWDRVRRDTDLKDGNENLVAGGGSVRESLLILLVDSGIPGRGHRKTLFDPKWNHVGINKIGDVGGIPNAWIQVFGTNK